MNVDLKREKSKKRRNLISFVHHPRRRMRWSETRPCWTWKHNSKGGEAFERRQILPLKGQSGSRTKNNGRDYQHTLGVEETE